VAGEIAAALGLPATNLSFHLKALTQAGLLSVTQEGRFQRYRAHMALMGSWWPISLPNAVAVTPRLAWARMRLLPVRIAHERTHHHLAAVD
jgi:DNA-binding transcriptional ArsR family regulator